METCNNCKYNGLDQNLNRFCHAKPPQIFIIPTPQGQAQVLSLRPQIQPNERACQFYRLELEK